MRQKTGLLGWAEKTGKNKGGGRKKVGEIPSYLSKQLLLQKMSLMFLRSNPSAFPDVPGHNSNVFISMCIVWSWHFHANVLSYFVSDKNLFFIMHCTYKICGEVLGCQYNNFKLWLIPFLWLIACNASKQWLSKGVWGVAFRALRFPFPHCRRVSKNVILNPTRLNELVVVNFYGHFQDKKEMKLLRSLLGSIHQLLLNYQNLINMFNSLKKVNPTHWNTTTTKICLNCLIYL